MEIHFSNFSKHLLKLTCVTSNSTDIKGFMYVQRTFLENKILDRQGAFKLSNKEMRGLLATS